MFRTNKNILIVRPGGIGDVVLTVPLLIAIQNYFERSKVTLLTNHAGGENGSPVDMLKTLDLIDDSIFIDFKRGKFRALLSLLGEARKCRKKYDILILLRHSNRGFLSKVSDFLLFKKLLGIELGFGVWNSSDLSFKFEGEGMVPMINEGDRLLNILRSEGLDLKYPEVEQYIIKKISDIPLRQQIKPDGKYIIFCPFGNAFKNKYNKRWKIDNYIYVCKRIIESGYSILLIGAPNDAKDAKGIEKRLGSSCINSTNRINLLELLQLCEKAEFYFGSDTGPMHFASIIGTKVVALFHPLNNPNKFSPYGENNIVLNSRSNINDIAKEDVADKIIESELI